jgi:L-glutamine-phosphate cytidylyltransferase
MKPPIKAVILAAGRGSRLLEKTDARPKCLIEIAGNSMLSLQLAALQEAGITEIGLVCGYRSEKIEFPNLRKFFNHRWNCSNMVSSLLCALDWLADEEFIVSYSDIVYQSRVVEALLESSWDIVLTYDPEWLSLWKLRFDSPLDDAETFRVSEDGALLEIGGQAERIEEIEGQFMGLLKFNPNGWRSVIDLVETLSNDERDRLDMTALISMLLSQGVSVQAVPIFDRWFEVDSERDLAVGEYIFTHYF